MAQVTAVFEGLIIAKEGSGKRGPWKLYNIKVNVGGESKKFGCGFDPVKAAVGDTVQFDAEENEKGYLELDPKSFTVLRAATAAESAAATAKVSSKDSDRQHSIETQALIKAGVVIVAAQIAAGQDVGDPAAAVGKMVRSWSSVLLHPAKKVEVAPPPPPVKAAVEESEKLPY